MYIFKFHLLCLQSLLLYHDVQALSGCSRDYNIAFRVNYRNLTTTEVPDSPSPLLLKLFYMLQHLDILKTWPGNVFLIFATCQIYFKELKRREIACVYPDIYYSSFTTDVPRFLLVTSCSNDLRASLLATDPLVFFHLRIFLFHLLSWQILSLSKEILIDSSFLSDFGMLCHYLPASRVSDGKSALIPATFPTFKIFLCLHFLVVWSWCVWA